MSFFRVNANCNGCLACVQNCPASALAHEDRRGRRTLRHNMALCARCGQCWRVCPQAAIEFEHLLQSQWDDVLTLDLVRCRVCGEPLYTAEFGRSVANRLEKSVDPVCSKHRQGVHNLARAYYHPGRPVNER